jgi:hypothetical protein
VTAGEEVGGRKGVATGLGECSKHSCRMPASQGQRLHLVRVRAHSGQVSPQPKVMTGLQHQL